MLDITLLKQVEIKVVGLLHARNLVVVSLVDLQ